MFYSNEKIQLVLSKSEILGLRQILALAKQYIPADEIKALDDKYGTFFRHSEIIPPHRSAHLPPHEGWSNYPTFLVIACLESDRQKQPLLWAEAEKAYKGFKAHPQRRSASFYKGKQQETIAALAQRLKALYEEWKDKGHDSGEGQTDGSLAAFAYSFVEWREIAEHLLNEYHLNGSHKNDLWINTDESNPS